LFANQYARHSISFVITKNTPLTCSNWISHNF